MEIMNPYKEEYGDIRICRLCGSNNKENVDIFASKPISSRNDDLLTKILTVYPLVLYKNDPLPQHICPKCIGNVSTTYQDIQQVLRQQNKWMNITKAVQPEHKYFRILDAVENSTKTTIERIKTSYNIEISNLPLRKLLTNPTIENQNTTVINTSTKLNITENVVKNIQTKLESNGFTIKRIKVPTSNETQQNLNNITDPLHFAEEICETNDNIVTCNYCQQKFSNMKILAQHQLIHLKLNTTKVFEKHLLPKQLRRGRLITLNDNKCIRCLNCWRIFKDNKSILQHWSGGDCEFYCSVCGKEYPHSPKMLREHVTTAHGISFRSISREFISNQAIQLKATAFNQTVNKSTNLHTISTNINTGLVKKVGYKKPPPKSCTKNEDGTITCKICHKVFDNFRSSNSHMRKHKPPSQRFGDSVFPQRAIVDNYNTQDDYMTQPTTSHFLHGPASLNMKPPRPAYRVIMKNGPLRGIKTKIVQKRHDYLSNYTNNEHYPMQRPMISSADTNEDDDENVIVPELLMPAIKSEPILDDNPHNVNGDNDSTYITDTSFSFPNAIKPEPLDNTEYAEVSGPHLCFICNESFSNTRDYELHAMFVHNIN